MMTRPPFEPICTTPCTGSTLVTGRPRLNTASMATPPPKPIAAVSADVRKLVATRTAANTGVISGGTNDMAFLGVRTASDSLIARPSAVIEFVS